VALFGLIGQPASLNPLSENHPALRELSPLLFETLLQVDPASGQLRPNLAQEWRFTAEGKQVSFRLPPGLTWSNGRPMTAAEIVASLTASQHPALLAFNGLNAPDETTLVLTFSRPNCSAVTSLGLLPLLPSREITATIPSGSGPFVVNNWSENRRTLSLARNPAYRGPPAQVGGIVARFLQVDELDLVLSEGQFDLVGPLSRSNRPDQLPASLTDLAYPTAQMIYLAVNYAPIQEEPLAPEVRQALQLGLDREAILSQALAGDGQLLAGSLLPGHWAANPALTVPDYDPAAAAALLRQAGLADSDGDGWLDQAGQRLELAIRLNGYDPLHQDLGWLISSYYRSLGLFARAEGVSYDILIEDILTHDYGQALYSWLILADPDQQFYWHSAENNEGQGLNITSYHNPDLDRLWASGNNLANCDPAARAQTYAEIQEILSRERPVDFLLAPNQHVLVGERLRGLRPGPFAPLTWNVTTWSLQGE
jgi:peptide/nickel transport system substrate-binding protein